jgi:hypothetical protein
MHTAYIAVAERAAHRCEYCHAPEAIFTLRFEVDHVIPVSQGGVDTPDNLALACRACNLWKSNTISGHDVSTGQQAPLFNPRHDLWDENFVIANTDAIRILGETATGRATVQQLRMNADAQCEARHWWVKIGLFP